MCVCHGRAFISQGNPESLGAEWSQKGIIQCWRHFSQKGRDEPRVCHKTSYQAANLASTKCSYITVGLWLSTISFHDLQTIGMKQGKICRAKSYDVFVSYGHSYNVISRHSTPNGFFKAVLIITFPFIKRGSTSLLLNQLSLSLSLCPPALPPSPWSKSAHVTLSQMLKTELCVLWIFWHCFIPPGGHSFSSNLMKS